MQTYILPRRYTQLHMHIAPAQLHMHTYENEYSPGNRAARLFG